jgi:hypothetical protein
MVGAAQVSEVGAPVKPSDLKSTARRTLPAPERALKFPVDPKADPPISIEEALTAGGANCPHHRGLVGQRGDKPGMVFLCLGCGMYWRYSKTATLSRRPLSYPKRSCV